jgi:tetratricopeptide (TPR) repeat protein
MSSKSAPTDPQQEAAQRNEHGLKRYADWEVDDAVADFEAAIALQPDVSDYHLNLARAHARAGRFHNAMEALGAFLGTEPEAALAERYEQLFGSAMDTVETTLIEGMRARDASVQQIGKGIQMWLEYRISLGHRPLDIDNAAVWSAALAFAIARINLEAVGLGELAAVFGVDDAAVRTRYDDLLQTLDLMPGDYRYFTGDDNPLDRLVDAAQALDEIYNRFNEE